MLAFAPFAADAYRRQNAFCPPHMEKTGSSSLPALLPSVHNFNQMLVHLAVQVAETFCPILENDRYAINALFLCRGRSGDRADPAEYGGPDNPAGHSAAEALVRFFVDYFVSGNSVLIDEISLAETERPIDIEPLLFVLEVDIPFIIS